MIAYDEEREVPTEWTNELCRELYNHARELGQNGNPAGYFLTIDLFSFAGLETENGNRCLREYSQWDYDGIRAWIAGNKNIVERVWKLQVRSDY
jgi:hypothetical protein